MSYGRNIEPQLLSIQAIIQKSEFKSKILNNIPVDLKKLFMEQVSKNSVKAPQPKRISALYEGLYSQTIDHHNDRNHRTKKSMPPLPSRPIKSQSLNSSMSKNMKNAQLHNVEGQRSVYTTRTNINSRQNHRKRIGRKSLGEEAVSIEKNNGMFNIENQNVNGLNFQSDNVLQAQVSIEPVQMNENKNKGLKFNRFQYELVLPQKDKKDRGFKKIIESGHKQVNKPHVRTKTEELQAELHRLQEKQLSQNNLQYDRNLNMQNPLTNKKKQAIPDFVLAAITDQNKKVSPSKNFQAPPQFFQLNLEPPQTAPENRQRIMKPPNCVINMKKKISYNKFRRSQESCEQIMQPKINFVKLVEKDRTVALIRKSTDGIHKQKRTQSKDRIPTYHKIKQKRAYVEEDVKGWDVVDGPQFYDQY